MSDRRYAHLWRRLDDATDLITEATPIEDLAARLDCTYRDALDFAQRELVKASGFAQLKVGRHGFKTRVVWFPGQAEA